MTKMDSASASQLHKDAVTSAIERSKVLSSKYDELANKMEETLSKETDFDGSVLTSLEDSLTQAESVLQSTASLVPKLRQSIAWLGDARENLKLVYFSGSDPWEFCLTYADDNNAYNEMGNKIKKMHSEGILVKCQPKVGNFVVCHLLIQGQSNFFRGLITNYNEKFKKSFKSVHVYRVDIGDKVALYPNDVYSIPAHLASIPSRVIKCCFLVGDEELKPKFCSEMQLAFEDAMNRTLTVDILGSVDGTNPPIFIADAWGQDASRCDKPVNLRSWINDIIIPRLKEIPPECSNLFTFIDECEILDPFCGLTENGAATVETSCEVGDKVDREASDYDVEHEVKSCNISNDTHLKTAREAAPTKLTDSSAGITSSVVATSNNNETPIPEPVGVSSQQPPNCEPLPASANGPLPASGRFPNPTASEFVTNSSASGSVTSATDTERSHKPALNSVSSTSAVKSVLQPSAQEFIPSCFVQITNNSNEDDCYDGVVANLQDEYQPTDEKRVCLFYQKKGYCNRKLCTKEHVPKTKAWTSDTTLTYCRTFNDIDLPSEGSEVQLTIQHIRSPTTFFATLDKEFSRTDEPDLETLDNLYVDLNSEESNNTHPLLAADPTSGELVIAMGLQQNLGPRKKWLRARVQQVLDDTHVQVFFIDFGNSEVVRLKDLRRIRPQFLHLPAQAVLTSLYGILTVAERRNDLIELLQSSILKKVLRARVTTRDLANGELEVILYLENNCCLNNILADLGLARFIGNGS